MTLSAACLRGLAVAPFVALWLVLPPCPVVERVTLAACRIAYPVSPAAKAPYLYALRTSPELAAFAHRDPFVALGKVSRVALAYVLHLEARASQTRSTE